MSMIQLRLSLILPIQPYPNARVLKATTPLARCQINESWIGLRGWQVDLEILTK